ncbi:hypothetical protein [Vibrio alginolyticus]|uniref:hypothetical protein n=1 Tax=Vibrio alginolyticus TaxID=663 RepID=UPI001BD541D4|nr:hypothetical protein [Vibrio alginolyticus]EGQ8042978.1 hypothetical protein [Vibrio alginolyticus]ELB2788738.1 hypothetical protein [Vibrio alginolyticus]MBT0058935.1 hypothetical protein [Vibrio alginolyticus]HCZ9540978.1 hypothetical protein [Vibrio alginolyticus]
MITDNAAARLLKILDEGKGISANFPAKQAWGKIFRLEDIETSTEAQSTLMSKLGQVMLLPHETMTLVEQYYPAQAPALNHTLAQIQAAFVSQNLSGKWFTFIQHIDTHCIDALSMTAALLENKLETSVIDTEQLDTFRIRVQDLIEHTIKSDLTSEFKKFMTHYLQKILSAINDYLISGAMPILDAVEATLGHAVLDPNFKEELKESETGQKIRDMLGDLANIVTVATAATGAVGYIATNGLPFLG